MGLDEFRGSCHDELDRLFKRMSKVDKAAYQLRRARADKLSDIEIYEVLVLLAVHYREISIRTLDRLELEQQVQQDFISGKMHDRISEYLEEVYQNTDYGQPPIIAYLQTHAVDIDLLIITKENSESYDNDRDRAAVEKLMPIIMESFVERDNKFFRNVADSPRLVVPGSPQQRDIDFMKDQPQSDVSSSGPPSREVSPSPTSGVTDRFDPRVCYRKDCKPNAAGSVYAQQLRNEKVYPERKVVRQVTSRDDPIIKDCEPLLQAFDWGEAFHNQTLELHRRFPDGRDGRNGDLETVSASTDPRDGIETDRKTRAVPDQVKRGEVKAPSRFLNSACITDDPDAAPTRELWLKTFMMSAPDAVSEREAMGLDSLSLTGDREADQGAAPVIPDDPRFAFAYGARNLGFKAIIPPNAGDDGTYFVPEPTQEERKMKIYCGFVPTKYEERWQSLGYERMARPGQSNETPGFVSEYVAATTLPNLVLYNKSSVDDRAFIAHWLNQKRKFLEQRNKQARKAGYANYAARFTLEDCQYLIWCERAWVLVPPVRFNDRLEGITEDLINCLYPRDPDSAEFQRLMVNFIGDTKSGDKMHWATWAEGQKFGATRWSGETEAVCDNPVNCYMYASSALGVDPLFTVISPMSVPYYSRHPNPAVQTLPLPSADDPVGNRHKFTWAAKGIPDPLRPEMPLAKSKAKGGGTNVTTAPSAPKAPPAASASSAPAASQPRSSSTPQGGRGRSSAASPRGRGQSSGGRGHSQRDVRDHTSQGPPSKQQRRGGGYHDPMRSDRPAYTSDERISFSQSGQRRGNLFHYNQRDYARDLSLRNPPRSHQYHRGGADVRDRPQQERSQGSRGRASGSSWQPSLDAHRSSTPARTRSPPPTDSRRAADERRSSWQDDESSDDRERRY